MAPLAAHGVEIDVVPGWDVSISLPEVDAVLAPGAPRLDGEQIARSGTTNPLVHLANFSLPARRGDFGQGATEAMASNHVFVALLEHDREAAQTALFQQHPGMPAPRAGEYRPEAQLIAQPSMAATQIFFTEHGRPWCLYAVIGSWSARKTLARSVRDVLDGIRILPPS